MAKTNLVSICFWRQYIDSVTPATGLLLTVLVLVVGCSESLTGSKKDSAETDGSRTGSILSRASDSARSASQTLSSAVDSNQPKRVEGKASAAVSNPKPNKASLLDNVPLSNTPIFRTAPSNDDIATIIDEAKPFFDHLAVLFPKDSDAYDIRGRFYYFLGDHLTARSCWEIVLIHHPTEPYCVSARL